MESPHRRGCAKARPINDPSVLDILPPHYGLRVAIMIAVITLMYGLAYLPWYLKDRKAAGKREDTPASV